MWRVFNRREQGAIVGGFAACVLFGIVMMTFGADSNPVDVWYDVFNWYHFNQWGPTGLAALFGIFAVYRASSEVKGSLGRSLTVIGIGYMLFAIQSIPHATWHGAGTEPGFLGLGLSIIGLEFVFHGATALLFFFMAYGFYLAYNAAHSSGGGHE